MVDWRCFAK